MLVEDLKWPFNCIEAPDIIVLNCVFHCVCSRVGLYISLSVLQGALQRVVGVQEVGNTFTAVLISQFSIFLHVIFFAFSVEDTHVPFQNVPEELRFGLGNEGPELQAREKHDISLPLLIVYNSLISTVHLVVGEHDHFWFFSQFVINTLLLANLLDPRQIAHEEGVSVHPHAAVVVEHQQSVEIGKTSLSEGGFALHELELGLGFFGQVVINAFAVEQYELPVVFLCGGSH